MVDGKDLKIIDVLRKHGDASTRDISDITNIPVSTVHQRKRKLENEGIIKQYTVLTDDSKLGMDFSAYVLLAVDLPQLRDKGLRQADLVRDLREVPEVRRAAVVTGGFDIMLLVKTSDKTAFNSVLQNKIQLLDGVSDTETLLILE